MKIYIIINQKVLFGILDVHIFFYKLGQTLQTFERTYMHYILARREYGGVWFLATFCQAKVWIAIKVWQPQKVWLRNWKPNFGKSWQEN
jgi:hypothetical protein